MATSVTSSACASTRDQLIAHAQTLISKRGYNGFSYRDLAEHVGVKTASIHYHFPQKDDLLQAAVVDYTAKITRALHAIDDSLPAVERLERYAKLFVGSPADQICMCGMLAADFASVPEPVRAALKAFFRLHENWLAAVIADGKREGTIKSWSDPQSSARTAFAAFQGALLASRLFQANDRVCEVLQAICVRVEQPA